MSDRFDKIVKDTAEGMKTGLWHGFIAGAVLEFIDRKFLNKSKHEREMKLVEENIHLINNPAELKARSRSSYFGQLGVMSVMGVAIGGIFGAWRGMFGKLPEEKHQPVDFMPPLPSENGAMSEKASSPAEEKTQAEPQKSHARGMQPAASHGELAARSEKEPAGMGR